jgi:SAM-dependent methyltransferase
MEKILPPGKKGPMSGDQTDYIHIYETELQGDFYGPDYYRPPQSDIDSAIIYDDGEDKRTTAALIALSFGPRRVLEAGCAMGLLVKALRGQGVEAEGFDFSKWCIDNAHPAAKPWLRHEDILDLRPKAHPYDMVLALDILEHLPPQKVRTAIGNLAAALEPGGILFTVVPAYGPNKFGSELYPIQYEEWKRDADAGIPFRNIPLDDRHKPHLGHLTHATIPWWEEAFRGEGLGRLGKIERQLHGRFDNALEFPRRSFFVFVKGEQRARRRRTHELLKRISSVPGLPRGFYEWERWEEDFWMRWTALEASDVIETRGRGELRMRVIANHPDIAVNPVDAEFTVDGRAQAELKFTDHDWHDMTLPLPRRQFAVLGIRSSRTWIPDGRVPVSLQRHLGVGLAYVL